MARVESLRRLIDDLDVEIDLFARLVRGRLVADPGYRAVQTIPGIGPILAAVFVAEIGDVHRFARPAQLASLGRADPQASRVRHPRAPRPDHQAGLPAGALGRGRVGPGPRPAHRRRAARDPGRRPPRPQHRQGRRRPGNNWGTSTGHFETSRSSISRRSDPTRARYGAGSPAAPAAWCRVANRSDISTWTPHLASTAWTSPYSPTGCRPAWPGAAPAPAAPG